MTNDDDQVGEILSRREILASMGIAGAALLTGSSGLKALVGPAGLPTPQLTVPACVVRPAQEEGPGPKRASVLSRWRTDRVGCSHGGG